MTVESLKLFIAPGSCSLAPHIVLLELGLAFETDRPDRKTRIMQDGFDFRSINSINPKGQVPALKLEDGRLLTECSVILQYLADQRPEAEFAPPPASFERYRLQEWLNFIGMELHRGMHRGVLGSLEFGEPVPARLDVVESRLRSEPYLLGNYTVADPYLFTVLRWPERRGVDLSRWSALQQFQQRMRERPAVQAALSAEGFAARDRQSHVHRPRSSLPR